MSRPDPVVRAARVHGERRARPGLRVSRSCFVLTAFALVFSMGCWEQWSETWFPQMKWQRAVQAYERVGLDGRVEGFLPPEGTVPVTGAAPPAQDPMDAAAQDALVNPRPATLASLENGRLLYARYCTTCHGDTGLGDGPVSAMGPLRGPFVGVLAIGGPASLVPTRTDGHLYATIRYGRRRMPGYQRIPSQDRWDIVNYLRYLNGQKGIE